MFSYVFMKVLESTPRRYDLGINLLSLGKVKKVKKDIADLVEEGERVLDIGCGTGALAIMMAERGAKVVGFDVSRGMLEVARETVASKGLKDRLDLKELGVTEMDNFEDESFDKAAATLVFSELSRDEQEFALREARRVLKEGGQLIIADEVAPEIDTCCFHCLLISALKKATYHLFRLPLLVVTYSLTQTTTRPVEGLKERVMEAGFKIISVTRHYFLEVMIAEKGERCGC